MSFTEAELATGKPHSEEASKTGPKLKEWSKSMVYRMQNK